MINDNINSKNIEYLSGSFEILNPEVKKAVAEQQKQNISKNYLNNQKAQDINALMLI